MGTASQIHGSNPALSTMYSDSRRDFPVLGDCLRVGRIIWLHLVSASPLFNFRRRFGLPVSAFKSPFPGKRANGSKRLVRRRPASMGNDEAEKRASQRTSGHDAALAPLANILENFELVQAAVRRRCKHAGRGHQALTRNPSGNIRRVRLVRNYDLGGPAYLNGVFDRVRVAGVKAHPLQVRMSAPLVRSADRQVIPSVFCQPAIQYPIHRC